MTSTTIPHTSQAQTEKGPVTSRKPTAIVAVGGHAFSSPEDADTVSASQRNAERISEVLLTIIEGNYNVVLTHGNGPQVGYLMRQNDELRQVCPAMPLDVLVAYTEGWLGYVLQQALLNQFRAQNIQRFVVTMVTQVLVDSRDAAFANPAKAVGRVMTEEEATERQKKLGWQVVCEPQRGWRRVVPSPRPIKVIQRQMIQDAAEQGHIVIAGGGGGIPIVKTKDGRYQGVEAVIDKDRTSALLGTGINAELFVILTDVPHVYVRYGQSDQYSLGAVTIQEGERLLAEGHFGKGSMEPKVEAILNFLRAGGRRGLITNPDSLAAALEGRGGTHFVGRL